MNRSAVLVVGALALVACQKGDLDIEGKACPCPTGDGYVCDPICSVCTRSGTAPGTVCKSGDGCVPKITFEKFKAHWVTPSSVRWAWEPSPTNQATDFQSYRVLVSSNGGSPVTYDSSTNPELGVYAQPNKVADLTNATTTDELESGQAYSAFLIATDRDGCESSASATAPVTPSPVNGAIEIFGPTPTTGLAYGGTLATDGCYGNAGQCLKSDTCSVTPDSGLPNCPFVFKVSELDTSIAGLSEGQFVQAYLELYVSTTSAAPLFWNLLWLRVGPETVIDGNIWAYEAFSVKNSETYKRIQVPLNELYVRDSDPLKKLDYATLLQGGINEVAFGATITDGSTLWLDEVFVRW